MKSWRGLIKLLVILVGCVICAISNESCWIHDDACNVRAEIFQNLEFSNGIAMQIDCFVNLETRNKNINYMGAEADADADHEVDVEGDGDGDGDGGGDHHQTKSATYLFLRRFMGIQAVMLDGCQTPLNTHTYGLEFLPICANVTKVSLQHFHMDSLIPMACGGDAAAAVGQQLELEYLQLQQNEIATIDDNSFRGNYPQLRVLEFQSNSLKVIQANAFRALRSLEHLRIVNEPVLMLKFANLFQYTAVITIHLESLKQMTSQIFRHLPETVQNVYVADTPFDREAVDVINARTLSNLTITNCALETFVLRDVHSTVKSINLNGNVLKTFEAHENSLKELDLGSNQLQYFDCEWLANLTDLERLGLKGNHIRMLSLYELLQSIPNGHYVDLRANRLQALEEADKEFPFWMTTHVRIKCDQNPWDCLWLHEFAHAYPEKFRILQYEKFISKINVNGLQCIPAEKPLEHSQVDPKKTSKSSGTSTDSSSPEKVVNISSFTVVYGGDQWEFKRNQRAEALIIVFMLPLGIAFLFLLLYMWIYCQKMFHLSYYKNFSCMRRSPNVPNPSQRFDVVRQIPPPHLQQADSARPLPAIHNHEEHGGGYEVPLHGMCSECNCKPLTNSLDKCNKAIHITYEESPLEMPHQIYEEIISVADHDHLSEDYSENNRQRHLHYDHLRFE